MGWTTLHFEGVKFFVYVRREHEDVEGLKKDSSQVSATSIEGFGSGIPADCIWDREDQLFLKISQKRAHTVFVRCQRPQHRLSEGYLYTTPITGKNKAKYITLKPGVPNLVVVLQKKPRMGGEQCWEGGFLEIRYG
ncbi:hypothetical protein T265_08328 [Opisthorchis viverrini]|uniref:Uncharacterized protein n=1 Tax=Opisthorchis viverrini TaxID=6198 RepID=A0A075A8T0_OPIVI|nr:hypothetical protein T265_08328 [Opisthorchis viverrini]KER23909.1 hypothetical protein T265_08328 [Opisthorchis viverrini]